MKHTNQLIGCCGLDCEKCAARIATRTNDNALREKTAALWTKLNGVTILPFCDKLCPVHNCVREKDWTPARTAHRWMDVQRWGKSP